MRALRPQRFRMLSTHDLLGRLHEVRLRLRDRVHLGAGDLSELAAIDAELDRRQVPIDTSPEAELGEATG